MRQILLTLLLIFSAWSVAAAPFAYSVNSNGVDKNTSDSLYRINLANGEASRINKVRPYDPINSDIEGLAFAPGGTLYAVDDADETLLTIDLASGFAQAVNGNPFNLNLGGIFTNFGLTFTCEGSLFMSSDSNQILYQLDKNLGAPVAISGGGATLDAPITALAAWGDKVYGMSPGRLTDQGITPSLYEVDVSTGKATLIGALGSAVKLYRNSGLAFDAEGQLWAITDRFNVEPNIDYPSQILKIDPKTGKAEAIAETPVIGFESLAITEPMGCLDEQPIGNNKPSGIPTLGPLSVLLMILSLLFIGGLNIRSKN